MYDVTSGEISKAAACKEDYVTWFIPLTLGKAEHPSWTKVLDKILPNEQDQRTLQEIFGVCLFPAFCPQAHFTLVGPAHTGKSTITRMLREMVGPGNSSSVSLGSLSKDHAAMGLIGSFVNVDSESGYLSSEA